MSEVAAAVSNENKKQVCNEARDWGKKHTDCH